MSTSVDQRGKGQPNQVSNGTIKDGVKEEEFDPYLQQQQQPPIQGYGPGTMSSPITDPFMPNYYNQPMSFPYLGQGLGDGAWSNGGDTSAMFSAVGGYDYNGMFSGFGYPQFWADYQPSEYWGQSATAPQGQARKDARGYAAEDYYRATDNMIPADPYAAMNGDVERDPAMNSVEQGLKGMNISMENQMDGPSGEMSHPSMDPSVQQGSVQNSGSSQAPKKTSWAAIASQPARPQIQKPRSIPRAPMNPARQQNLDIGTWDSNKNSAGGRQGPPQPARSWSAPRSSRTVTTSYNGSGGSGGASNPPPSNSGNAGLSTISAPSNGGNGVSNHPVLEKLKSANQYNPKDFAVNTKGARYFIIKSYSEDDIHRSIKYSIWCSTEHGNKRLDAAFKEREGKGPIYLLFSVNGSGHFCGMAEMKTGVDYQRSAGVWAQDKWKGQIEVKWIYVKDVPNSQLRHIRLENNENKPVTNSRDTQEVPPEKGKQVLKIIHNYKHTTSIFDDFGHYEKRQEEDVSVTKRAQPEDYGRDRQGSSKGGRGGRQN